LLFAEFYQGYPSFFAGGYMVTVAWFLAQFTHTVVPGIVKTFGLAYLVVDLSLFELSVDGPKLLGVLIHSHGKKVLKIHTKRVHKRLVKHSQQQ
ncbi:hypothetical protein L9F63_011458, partial [Diploptera punctata]